MPPRKRSSPRAADPVPNKPLFRFDTWDHFVSDLIDGALRAGILVLFGIAAAIIGYTLYHGWVRRDAPFVDLITTIINSILLVFIVLELIHTAHYQLENPSERLGVELVNKLLIIGILSSIRHILTAGAELATVSGPPNTISSSPRVLGNPNLVHQMVIVFQVNQRELHKHISDSLFQIGVNAAVVLALVVGLLILKSLLGHRTHV